MAEKHFLKWDDYSECELNMTNLFQGELLHL